MIAPEDIKEVMGRRALSACDLVFEDNRPNASDEKLDKFIVVSLPYSPANRTMGENDDWWLDLTVVFEIYVADRKSARKPNRTNSPVMKAIRNRLQEVFPIVDYSLGIKIVRPRTVINSSSDGNGYHFSRIQAKMTTLV